MLLRQDWLYLSAVLQCMMAKATAEMDLAVLDRFVGKNANVTPIEGQADWLDIEEVIYSEPFQGDQVNDPAFWHAFGKGLVCCNEKLL